jgi:hypothetical protein
LETESGRIEARRSGDFAPARRPTASGGADARWIVLTGVVQVRRYADWDGKSSLRVS